MTQQNIRRSFVINWSEIERWDFLSALLTDGFHIQHPIVLLRDLCEVRRESIPTAALLNGEATLLDKVTFNGEVVAGSREKTRMEQYLALPGDLVVSKIRARQGSIGIVSNSHGRIGVSSHYRALIPHPAKTDRLYLWLALRSEYGRTQFLAATGGAAKGEISEENLLNVQVPLPSLAVQQAIVDHWQKGQRQARESREQAELSERQAIAQVSVSLGRLRSSQAKPKFFALPWSVLGQWGFDPNTRVGASSTDAHFPEVLVSQVCKISSGGTPPRHRSDYFGGSIPWVKTTEVRDSVISGTEEYLTEEGLRNSSARIYPKGSLIVAMYGQGATRGRTAKLGLDASTNQACAVLTEFDSSIEPDYLWFYLMSEYDQLRALASGNNQPNLNAGMIANYPIPLPPLDIQREIVARVAEARAEAGRLREEAQRLREETQAKVEGMILGTVSVENEA